jgi:hypothetical protein
MGDLSGSITARLADRSEEYEKSLADEINRMVSPPRPVTPRDVHIRAMYIVSDQVNSQGGRFAAEELDRLAEMIVDSPVMVGHRRDSLPVARNFKAVKLEVDGRTWIKSYFYWMRDGAGAEDLRKNIDGGIYKECSISFLFTKPECSICGEDIRSCPHIPFHEYEVDGRMEIAHFTYRDIIKVLETSLVFRGAVPDTRITDRLASGDEAAIGAPVEAIHQLAISDISDAADETGGYGQAPVVFMAGNSFVPDDAVAHVHICSYQPGIVLRIVRDGDSVDVETPVLLPEAVHRKVRQMIRQTDVPAFSAEGILYASHGRNRLNAIGLMRLIDSESNLHRLRLRLCDLVEAAGESCGDRLYHVRVEQLRAAFDGRLPDGIDIIHFHSVAASDFSSTDLKATGGGYVFGVEAVNERADGTLIRAILRPEETIPAVVESLAVQDRSHVVCDIRPLGDNGKCEKVICANTAGIADGAMVLVTASNGGRKAGRRLIDVLPGGDSMRILTASTNDGRRAARLYHRREDHRLTLCFRSGDDWLAAVVHHFSTALFERHRRFISDIESGAGNDMRLFSSDHLPVRKVTQTGRLIRIELESQAALFGNVRVLWFRPVAIDGEERYLFYAGETNSCSGGE